MLERPLVPEVTDPHLEGTLSEKCDAGTEPLCKVSSGGAIFEEVEEGLLDSELLDAAGEWCQAEAAAAKAGAGKPLSEGSAVPGANVVPVTEPESPRARFPQAPLWARWPEDRPGRRDGGEDGDEGVDQWASIPGVPFDWIGIGFKDLAEEVDQEDDASTTHDCDSSADFASDLEDLDEGAEVVIGFRADIGEGDGFPDDPFDDDETEMRGSEPDEDLTTCPELDGATVDGDLEAEEERVGHYGGPRNARERIADLIGIPLPKVTHILFVIHGMGATEEGLQRNTKELQDSLDEMQKYWFWHTNIAVHVEMIDWKSSLSATQSEIFNRITPDEARNTRMSLNSTLSDAIFYKTAHHRAKIYDIVTRKMNEGFHGLRADPSGRFADARVSVVGHSLGSVIAYDVLSGYCGPDMNSDMPKLDFQIDTLFLWGSPLAAFVSIADIEHQHGKFILPDTVKVCNIFHPHDPVAFRIEPLYYHAQEQIPPEMIAHYVNNGFRSSKQWARSYEYAKGLARQKWTAFKSRVYEVLGASDQADFDRAAWQSYLDSDQDLSSLAFQPGAAGSDEQDGDDTMLTHKVRMDYVLQEHAGEALVESYGLLQSHFCYWTSRDVALLMLKKMGQQETAELNSAERERADAAEEARLEAERRAAAGEDARSTGAWAIVSNLSGLSSDDVALRIASMPCISRHDWETLAEKQRQAGVPCIGPARMGHDLDEDDEEQTMRDVYAALAHFSPGRGGCEPRGEYDNEGGSDDGADMPGVSSRSADRAEY